MPLSSMLLTEPPPGSSPHEEYYYWVGYRACMTINTPELEQTYGHQIVTDNLAAIDDRLERLALIDLYGGE